MAIDYSIYYNKCLRTSIAMKAAIEGLYDLVKDKTPQQCIGSSMNFEHEEVLIAIDDHTEEVLGFIAYYPYHNDTCYYISLAFVYPQYRRQGIHSALFEALKKRAEENKIALITSATGIENNASFKSQQSQGRILDGYNFSFYPLVSSMEKVS